VWEWEGLGRKGGYGPGHLQKVNMPGGVGHEWAAESACR